jgi:hypothetical protein
MKIRLYALKLCQIYRPIDGVKMKNKRENLGIYQTAVRHTLYFVVRGVTVFAFSAAMSASF